MTPTLSIIIPAYNVQDYIAEAVFSALSQTFRQIEVIVVDDGSTDKTLDIIRCFDDPRLRVVTQPNSGLSAARNTGIRTALAEYIGFLDGDDRWHSEKASHHLTIMRSDPCVGVTFSHSAYIDEDGHETGRTLFSAIREPTLRQMILRNHVGNGSSPVVRADCFRSVGFFDEALRGCEDWEMWVRILRDTHFRARLIPGVLTYYRTNTRSLSMNFDSFLWYADLAATKIKVETPQLSGRVVDRGLAMTYRIAGTKAFNSGDRRKASALLLRAILISPLLLVTDPRLVGTVGAMMVPPALTRAAHNFLGACLRRFTRV